MVLAGWDKQVIGFQGEGFHLAVPLWRWEMIKMETYIFMFPKKKSTEVLRNLYAIDSNNVIVFPFDTKFLFPNVISEHISLSLSLYIYQSWYDKYDKQLYLILLMNKD